MSNAETVEDILNFGAKIKMIAKTSSGGDLDALTLAEQRQDFSVIKVLQSYQKKVWTLKEICRFSIRNQLVSKSVSKYNSLQIPQCLTEYLKFS